MEERLSGTRRMFFNVVTQMAMGGIKPAKRNMG